MSRGNKAMKKKKVKKQIRREVELKISYIIQQAGLFLNKYADVVSCVMSCMLIAGIMMYGIAYASGEELWNQVSGLIQTWVTRLGGVVMFVGGIMFGLGWKSDDAEQKSRGIQTMIAGAIVIAVATLTTTFFSSSGGEGSDEGGKGGKGGK